MRSILLFSALIMYILGSGAVAGSTDSTATDTPASLSWVRTWGGSGDDTAFGLAIDTRGNAFVTGGTGFSAGSDPRHIDPVLGMGTRDYDAYLRKFDSTGELLRERTWGATGPDIGTSVGLDSDGNVLVGGEFTEIVDFDPGPQEDYHAWLGGESDCFLCKYTSDGTFLWARTWGDTKWDRVLNMATDNSGNIYVSGWFGGTVDFDPGPSTVLKTATGQMTGFVSKFDKDGRFMWVQTFGESAYGVAVDSHNDVLVSANARGQLDSIMLLSKLDSNGEKIFERSWSGGMVGGRIAVDSSDNIYASGLFWHSIDFGQGSVESPDLQSGGNFLCKSDSSGNPIWARVWGMGPGNPADFGPDVALGSDGSILVVGDFGGTVDFDPGTGADEHTAAGEGMSMFLSRFGPDGNFLMAKTWGSQGGSHRDFADRVATDPSGAAYVAGAFAGVLDTAGLDPSAQMPEAPGGNRDAYLLKFQLQPLPSRAETATKSLQKRISGPNWLATWGEASDSKSAVRAVADDTGSVYVVSSSSPADGSLNDVTSPGESGEKMTLTKFARDGSISWKRDWKLASVGIVNDLIDLDAHGNIYICGVFSGTVDFDPGPGRLDLTSSSDRSVFLLKLDSSGTLVHAAKGPEASILEMDVGDSGDIYLCGTFSGTVDFDPGPGVSELTASAFLQTIACCFDSTGGFKWVNAMPVSPMGPLQSSIGVDQSENLYILTYFTGTVDFDPGPGVDNHTAIPNRVYLCLTKFSPNGDHQWSRSWGQCGEVAVRVDGLGFAYVCGGFGGTVDFDPGPAFEVRTSETDQGAFMSKFSSQGDFLGVDTWTEVYLTSFLGFAVDSSGRGLLNESVLVFSTRRAESSSPVIDAQIRMIEQGKQEPVQHTWRWNLPDYSHINCIATDREGNIYLAGSLSGTMPIPFRDGAVQATSVGGYDAFLLKLDPERSEIAPPQ